jgi:hypothetical protein
MVHTNGKPKQVPIKMKNQKLARLFQNSWNESYNKIRNLYQTGKWRPKETKTKNMEKTEPENFYSTS